jgi:hypothetical protein
MKKLTDEQKQAIVDAVMLCEFSELLNNHFIPGGSMPVGLSDLVSAKTAAKSGEDWFDRVCRLKARIQLATECCDLAAVEKYTAEWRKAITK